MAKQEMTLQYEVKNYNRKWYQFWKPRFIHKEITMHDVEIIIGEERIDDNGNLSYEVSISPKGVV